MCVLIFAYVHSTYSTKCVYEHLTSCNVIIPWVVCVKHKEVIHTGDIEQITEKQVLFLCVIKHCNLCVHPHALMVSHGC